MATNLLLLETDQLILGIGSPRYEREWGNLCLDILSYQRHKILENEDLPWTKLYVGTNQSLRGLGVEREGINVLGFQFNSGDYAYWHDSSQFIDDLRWVRNRKQLDLSRITPLGHLTPEGIKAGSFRLERESYGLILEKILEAQRK